MSDGAQELVVSREGVAGRLSLNRPRALHALTRGMCETMSDALARWADDDDVRVVIIDHRADPGGDPRLSRGFCAGGDIALLRRSVQEDSGESACAFFALEYRLNYRLFTYPKPVVAFMDGITMGGGVGISQPARWRVATRNTRFAMPETGIGLFPDVGGGWYLSRLPGALGPYLAATGSSIDGADCVRAGLATHWLATETLAEAKARICAGAPVEAVLAELAVDAPASPLAEHEADIARHFASGRIDTILGSLTADPSAWAQETLAALRRKCPTSVAVSLRLLAESRTLDDFAQELALEYRLVGRMVRRPDFAEGVRAVIVDKDNAPSWRPASIEQLDADDIASLFAPLDREWSPGDARPAGG